MKYKMKDTIEPSPCVDSLYNAVVLTATPHPPRTRSPFPSR